MWNEIIIKAGNIQNLTEARYYSSKSADLIGFNFDESSGNAIEPLQAQQIKEWLEGPEIIAEFGEEKLSKIQEISTVLNITTVKIPFARKEECKDLSARIILGVTLEELPENFKTENILQIKVSTESLEDSKLKKLIENNQIILEADWNEDALIQCLELEPYGINFNGSGELKTGAKSFEEMDILFESMEDEF